jgi:hypothetical protein
VEEYLFSRALFAGVCEWAGVGTPSVDAFASCRAALVPPFWGTKENALLQNWEEERLLWMNPPLQLARRRREEVAALGLPGACALPSLEPALATGFGKPGDPVLGTPGPTLVLPASGGGTTGETDVGHPGLPRGYEAVAGEGWLCKGLARGRRRGTEPWASHRGLPGVLFITCGFLFAGCGRQYAGTALH